MLVPDIITANTILPKVVLNPKKLYNMLLRKQLYEFLKEFWDVQDSAVYSDCWLTEYQCECFQYSVKHFLPYYIVSDWISDEEYALIKKRTGGHCDVRDKMINEQHVHNHNWNMPPRHTKSTVHNVFGPSWVAINCPIQIASVSHTSGLSVEMNTRRQKIFESDKFKYYFKEDIGTYLSKSSASQIILANNSKLYSVSQSSFTGFGADVIIADDLVSADNARKDAGVLKAAVSFFRKTLPTRLNTKRTGVIWHIQQRLGEGDVSSVILDNDGIKRTYSHTEIKALAEKDDVIIYPCSGKVKYIKKGDVLWPDRFGDYSILRSELGEDEFQIEYQQNVAYSHVNTYKRNDFSYIDEVEARDFIDASEVHYASHDCPVKDGKQNDYHGYAEGYGTTGQLIITDSWEQHLGYSKEKELMIDLETMDPSISQIVEEKANGAALLQDLSLDLAGLIAFDPGDRSKTRRQEIASRYVKNGSVRFLKGNENIDRLISKLIRFPIVEHDDDCDAFSQMVIYHFTFSKLGVYTGHFSFKNIIPDIVRDENNVVFYAYAATMVGADIKVLAMNINFKEDTYTVEKEWLFSNISTFIEFCGKEINKGETFLDASINNSLSSIINNVGLLEYDDDYRDETINVMRAGFFNKKILICKSCRRTITDISRLRITSKSRDAGNDKVDTYDEGYAGCLRTLIYYHKGTNAIW